MPYEEPDYTEDEVFTPHVIQRPDIDPYQPIAQVQIDGMYQAPQYQQAPQYSYYI